ncbi:MAG: tetratricopeptide repeat protein [Gemmatimonadetes bacterium]|nr:tetratricopeptide repeat protein [Gemmatimonadota bacterium]
MHLRFLHMCVLALALFATAGPSPAKAETSGTAHEYDWDEHHLRRAIDLWSRGDLAGAWREIANKPLPPAGAELGERDARALVLRAHLARALFRAEAWSELVDWAASHDRDEEASLWIRLFDLADRAGTPLPAFGAADLEAIGGTDTPFSLYARIVLGAESGQDMHSSLEALAKREARTPFETDLIARANFRLMTLAVRDGADPAPYRARIPYDGPVAADAAHVYALHLLATGKTGEAREEIAKSAFIGSNPAPALQLASLLLGEQKWEDACRVLAPAEDAWLREGEALEGLAKAPAGRTDSLWNEWETGLRAGNALALDAKALDERHADRADRGADLRRNEVFVPRADDLLSFPTRIDRDLASLHSLPDHSAWNEIDSIDRESAENEGARIELDAKIRMEREHAARLRAYLEEGRRAIAKERNGVIEHGAWIDRLVASVTAAVIELETLTERTKDRIARKTASVITRAERNMAIGGALHSFYVDGPNRSRERKFPDGVPTPEQLLAHEDSLAFELGSWSAGHGEKMPPVLDRSLRERWIPNLTNGVQALAKESDRQEIRADRIAAVIDSALAENEAERRIIAWEDERKRLLARQEELAAARNAAGRAIVAAALDAAAAEHHAAGEGIAYTLAIATDERAHAQELAPLRDEAIDRFSRFLNDYANEATRADVRFRLADQYLTRDKEQFQKTMAAFLEGTGGATPFIDYAPALALYESILAEDHDFPHLDAVLFHIGMIRLEQSDATGVESLARLVREYPESPYYQESHLRIGDDLFLGKRHREAVPHFEEAAAGTDPELAAIALYKIGWSYFSFEDYDEAARSFRRLLDHSQSLGDSLAADLRTESEEYLIHSLARGGGAATFEALFDANDERGYERGILRGLSRLYRRFSLYDESGQADRLWLARYETDGEAIQTAKRLIDTYEQANRKDLAMAAREEFAPRFLPGSPWHEANDVDSLRALGDAFAFDSYRKLAVAEHLTARESGDTRDWEAAYARYETLLGLWDQRDGIAKKRDGIAKKRDGLATVHYYAGEAAAELARYAAAIDHYGMAAESDSLRVREDAAFQIVATHDRWYEAAKGEDETGPDSLAQKLMSAITGHENAVTDEARLADLLWRKASIAYLHGWNDLADTSLARFASRCPRDERAATAAQLRAQILFDDERFERAATAYEEAARVATGLGRDSLATALRSAVPVSLHRLAEQTAADSSRALDAARQFENLALRHPEYEHAGAALYRAGIAYRAGERVDDAVRAWNMLIEREPESEWVKDSHLQIAESWEENGNSAAAARAFERFSTRFPDDSDAGPALMKAADLLLASGDSFTAETIYTQYLERFPEDTLAAFAILGKRADRDLETVAAGRPYSEIAGDPSTAFAQYRTLATEHPALADRSILARGDFLAGEETHARYRALRLTQPIQTSIEAKKAALEEVLQVYGSCVAGETAPWNRAAAHRIGEALVHFGESLVASELPSGIAGDDLLAYQEVLEEQAWEFYDRGEEAWGELIRRSRNAEEDDGNWIAKTRELLWPRVAKRFLHMPAFAFPTVAAEAPPEPVIVATEDEKTGAYDAIDEELLMENQ